MDALTDKLFRCAVRGHYRQLEKLLLSGADANAVCDENHSIHCYKGVTPLMAAASAGHVKCVEILLRRGADPHYINENKNNLDLHFGYSYFNASALMRAAHMSELGAIKALLVGGADVNQVNCRGYNALSFACYQFLQDEVYTFKDRQKAVIDFLIEEGISINHKNQQGETLLQEIMYDTFEPYFDSDAIIYLIEKGFDPYVPDAYGNTIADLAILAIGNNMNNLDTKDGEKLLSFLEQRELDKVICEHIEGQSIGF